MSTPQLNPDGYERGSVIRNVTNFAEKKFLLVHGMFCGSNERESSKSKLLISFLASCARADLFLNQVRLRAVFAASFKGS
jgi:hypothetical protein